jgi:hypothetical protein
MPVPADTPRIVGVFGISQAQFGSATREKRLGTGIQPQQSHT